MLVNRRLHRGEYPVGVSYDKQRDKFLAGYSVNGVRKGLGRYDTIEEAFRVYKLAKESHIKQIADAWKSSLDDRVYNALINYNVDMYD